MAEQPLTPAIKALSLDFIQSDILTRLDGESLAALSCTCSELHSLSTEQSLWREKCAATWPSSLDPRVHRVISTFPDGYRSFFSDSFPFLTHGDEIDLSPSVDTTELISAVDLYYKDEMILSTVNVTETISGWFLCSPLRIDLVEPKKSISTRISYIDEGEDDTWKNDLEKNLLLTWILIDSTGKRAVDISSRKPVSVQRHWLTGEILVRFSTVFVGEKRRSESDLVEFGVTVVMAGVGGRDEEETAAMHIKEVSLVAEDMEGKNLEGRGSLVILKAAMGRRRRLRLGGVEEGKERYGEFINRKAAKKRRRSKEIVMNTTPWLVAGVLIGLLLCIYLFIHKNIVAMFKKLKKFLGNYTNIM